MINAQGMLAEFLQEHNGLENALNLGAGTGYESLLCASFGLYADAIDNNTMPLWKYPEYLKQHPKINYHETDINSYLLNTSMKYEVITMFNVLHLLDRAYTKELLWEQLAERLQENGYILCSFFLPEDKTIQNGLKLTDFIGLEKYFTITFTQKTTQQDNHPPLGLHEHHIQYLILKKRTD